jgi:hypothetical protein
MAENEGGRSFGKDCRAAPQRPSNVSRDIDPSIVILVSDSLLVTNGMEQNVCVHGFSIAPFDEEEIVNMVDQDDGAKKATKMKGAMMRIGSTLDGRRN